MEQGKNKVNLEHLVLPESKEIYVCVNMYLYTQTAQTKVTPNNQHYKNLNNKSDSIRL